MTDDPQLNYWRRHYAAQGVSRFYYGGTWYEVETDASTEAEAPEAEVDPDTDG